MKKIDRGTWVEIEQVVLQPDERAANLPEDTKKVPYILHVSGFLTDDCRLDETAAIRTMIGRQFTGKIIRVNPGYHHSFGETIPELLAIGVEMQK